MLWPKYILYDTWKPFIPKLENTIHDKFSNTDFSCYQQYVLYSMSEFVGMGKMVMKEKSAVFLQNSLYFVDWKKCKQVAIIHSSYNVF